jgi:glucose/arabinose dehydrogenase
VVLLASLIGCSALVNGVDGRSVAAGTSVPDLSSLQLGVVRVANGLSQPVAAAWRQGDSRMYVAEKTGRVRLIHADGSLVANPVLDLTDSIATSGEQGLLGLTFSPDGTKMYVDYTDTTGDIQIVEYTMAGDAADMTTRRVLLTIPHSTYGNHNGGEVTFGPDGDLYISVGDGGGAGDPLENAQNKDSLLGKILRIDPTPSGGLPYTVPPNNPFVGQTGTRPEIWMYGLRNPWRFSFDRQTQEMWIGDVGQDLYEEVDLSAPAQSGTNFGWNLREGLHPYNGGTEPLGAQDPLFEEPHSDGWCAIIGGYVYRGTAIPGLQGAYVFGDDCRTGLVGVSESGGVLVARDNLDINISALASLSEDPSGELYLLSLTGTVYKLVAGNSSPTCNIDGSALAKGTSIRISHGLTPNPATRPTTLRFVGDLTGCTGFDNVPTRVTPVTAGIFHVTVRTNPGATCSTLPGGVILNSSFIVAFKGLRKGKPAGAETERTTVANVTLSTDDDGHYVFTIVSAPITKPTSGLNGRKVTLQITTDQDISAIVNDCVTLKKGLTGLTFNAGPSALAVG